MSTFKVNPSSTPKARPYSYLNNPKNFKFRPNLTVFSFLCRNYLLTLILLQVRPLSFILNPVSVLLPKKKMEVTLARLDFRFFLLSIRYISCPIFCSTTTYTSGKCSLSAICIVCSNWVDWYQRSTKPKIHK